MTLADRLDDFGKPAWIAATILSFVVFWPAGLVFLGYMIGSGRMGHCMGHGSERWQERMARAQQRVQERMERAQQKMQEHATRWTGGPWSGGSGPSNRPSGNRAFDEYRTETLRRLEEEQREFMDFLERLRHAKDKAEFDQFMAQRRPRPEGPPLEPSQY
jgi:hypothetical protein